MAYRFKRKETVDAGVRRIGAECLQRSLSRLAEDRDPLEAIHNVRKDLKKARALLRLIRPCLPQKLFRREARILRDAAVLLAGARDARVKLQTFRDVTQRFKPQLGGRAFPKIHRALEAYCAREEKLFLENDSVAKALACLDKIKRHVKEWRVDDDEWPAIEPGLRWTYCHGRREHRLVQDKPTPANFHSWRKRVKDLGYQLCLVRGAWPEIIQPTIDAANQLGEYLGDDHDAAVLREALYDDELAVSADEVDTLIVLIEQRQRELRGCALALGARLYAEKPGRFCDRLGAWWCQWRHANQFAGDAGPVLHPPPKGRPRRVMRVSPRGLSHLQPISTKDYLLDSIRFGRGKG